jgi:hypothetical protein
MKENTRPVHHFSGFSSMKKCFLSVYLSRLLDFGGSTELADFHRNRWLSKRGSESRKEFFSRPAQRGTKLKFRFLLKSRGNLSIIGVWEGQ